MKYKFIIAFLIFFIPVFISAEVRNDIPQKPSSVHVLPMTSSSESEKNDSRQKPEPAPKVPPRQTPRPEPKTPPRPVPRHEPQPTVHFHGHRLNPWETDFKVVDIKSVFVKRNGKNETEILIKFSSPLDPRSIRFSNIYVNGKLCPSSSRINYSKDGQILRLTIFSDDNFSYKRIESFELRDVKSFNGHPLEISRFENIPFVQKNDYEPFGPHRR